MDTYLLTAVILFIMALLIRLDRLQFIVKRYEVFQRFIRRKALTVDEKSVSEVYSAIFSLGGALSLVLFFDKPTQYGYLLV